MMLGAVLEAAREIENFLAPAAANFCFIGGVAVQRWGEPRFTRDADLSLLTEFVHDEKWVDLLLSNFPAHRPDAREFALSHRVVLLRATQNQIFQELEPLADLKEDPRIVSRLKMLISKRNAL